MKKITKRIMALMLSLVMILGCVPSFINEANALGENATLAEILNTVEGGFPNSIEDAWESDNGKQVIYEEGKLKFLPNNIEFDGTIEGTLMGSAYSFNNNSFFCNIENNKLISIFSYEQDYGGTYKPVKTISTIADVLATVEFPTNTSDAWANDNQAKVNLYSKINSLIFLHPTEVSYNETISTSKSVSTSDNGATYCYSDDDKTIYFNMTDGILTSINVEKFNDSTTHVAFNGKYEPVKTPIERVDLVSSGILATNIQTIKFEAKEGDDAPYTLNYTNDWYSINDTTPYVFSSTGTAYKKIFLTPKSGYKFVNGTEVYYYDDLRTYGGGNIQSDGTLLARISAPVKAGTISLDFEKPEAFADFKKLKADRTKFTMVGKNLDNSDDGYDGIDASELTQNINDKGCYYIWFIYSFADDDELNKIQNMIFRNEDLQILDSFNSTQLLSMNVGDICCYKINRSSDSKYQIKIYEKYNFKKQATITCPITAGTTVGDIKQAIISSFTTTASTDTGEIADFDDKKDISIINITDERALLDTDVLESNKEYYIDIVIDDVEGPVYSSVKVNNTNLTLFTSDPSDPEIKNNHFSITNKGINVFYKFDTKQSSGGGSKTYKAKDDKDTAEKISGSGKKGSKRIVTPQEGRKVESVIVTDKDGNRYEVTNEGDGTYSFIQPGTNVDVEVKYKNRLIELTIGSLDASVDDVHHNLDVVPKVVNDRTMLPIRFVAENLGAKVDWDEKDPDTVVITRGDTRIEITLGSDIAKVNGQEYKLDSVAFAENDRTYLPVRFVSEKLNAIVEWNEAHPMDVKIYERQ